MLKRFSILTILVAATLVVGGCRGSKKTTEVPDGGTMDSNINSQDMAFDSMGSDSGSISGLHTVNFELDSSSLSSESRRLLGENADWIKARPNVTVQVEGHCDNRGSVEYNLALGERRAKAVKAYLGTLGVDSRRLTIISYGEEKPLVPGDNEEAYARNRRANFVPLAQ